MDLTNLASKVVRAVRFYLISTGATTAATCYHHFDNRARNFDNGPITDVRLAPIGPDVQFSGNNKFRVQIVTAFNAALQPQDNPYDETARVAFDAAVGAVRAQMMLSNDGGVSLHATRDAINAAAATMSTPVDANNANAVKFANANKDMDDFSVVAIYEQEAGAVKIEGVNWAVAQTWMIEACETKLT